MEEGLYDKLEMIDLGVLSEGENEQLQSYVQSEIAEHITEDDNHSVRVRAMINKMLNQ